AVAEVLADRPVDLDLVLVVERDAGAARVTPGVQDVVPIAGTRVVHDQPGDDPSERLGDGVAPVQPHVLDEVQVEPHGGGDGELLAVRAVVDVVLDARLVRVDRAPRRRAGGGPVRAPLPAGGGDVAG